MLKRPLIKNIVFILIIITLYHNALKAAVLPAERMQEGIDREQKTRAQSYIQKILRHIYRPSSARQIADAQKNFDDANCNNSAPSKICRLLEYFLMSAKDSDGTIAARHATYREKYTKRLAKLLSDGAKPDCTDVANLLVKVPETIDNETIFSYAKQCMNSTLSRSAYTLPDFIVRIRNMDNEVVAQKIIEELVRDYP